MIQRNITVTRNGTPVTISVETDPNQLSRARSRIDALRIAEALWRNLPSFTFDTLRQVLNELSSLSLMQTDEYLVAKRVAWHIYDSFSDDASAESEDEPKLSPEEQTEYDQILAELQAKGDAK